MGMLLWLALAGQGGPIIAALSVSFWTPIARLTFGVYLTHIMLIRLLYNTTERSFNYEDYLGALPCSFSLAVSIMNEKVDPQARR